jgi:hypothetical protein
MRPAKAHQSVASGSAPPLDPTDRLPCSMVEADLPSWSSLEADPPLWRLVEVDLPPWSSVQVDRPPWSKVEADPPPWSPVEERLHRSRSAAILLRRVAPRLQTRVEPPCATSRRGWAAPRAAEKVPPRHCHARVPSRVARRGRRGH